MRKLGWTDRNIKLNMRVVSKYGEICKACKAHSPQISQLLEISLTFENMSFGYSLDALFQFIRFRFRVLRFKWAD